MKRIGFFILTFCLGFPIAWVAFGSFLGSPWNLVKSLVLWFGLTLLFWQARKLRDNQLLIIGLVVLLGLFWPTSSIIESDRFYHYRLPQPFLSILDTLVFCWFLLALILAAVLFYRGIQKVHDRLNPQTAGEGENRPADSRAGWKPAWMFGLSALLLGMFLHNLAGLLMWDNTTDSLDVLWLMLPSLVCLMCGITLLISLPGKSKLAGLVFVFLLPFLMWVVCFPAENFDFRTLTRERGERITYAIDTYFQREGHYPQSLGQLVPRDLRAVDRPFIVNGQNWCYDAGEGYYRLGYVDREHWSSPCYYEKLVSSAGDVSGLSAVCEAPLAELKAPYDTTGIIGCK